MGTTTTNMSLEVPSSGDSDYPTQISDSMTLLDRHDHTTGKGVQIPTGGIADSAVTSKKLDKHYDIFDYVLGSAAQVTAGVATHSTWAALIAAASDGSTVLVLPGSITENVTITKRLFIQGKGRESIVDGTFKLDTGSDYSTVRNIKCTGNVTLASNASYFTECYLASTKTITDSGAGNSYKAIQE